MTRVIFGIGAVLAAAVALAGCGGGGSNAAGTTVGTTMGTTGGVAGVQTTKGGGMSFNAQVNGMQKQLTSALKQLRNGNVAGAASAGGSLLTTCQSTVNKKLAPRAKTAAQQQVVAHLRLACQDMANSSQQAASGNMQQAKQLAQQALVEVTSAKQALASSGS